MSYNIFRNCSIQCIGVGFIGIDVIGYRIGYLGIEVVYVCFT